MLRVAIRADASAALGTGHLKRCLSLARALRGCGADVVFLVRRADGVAATLLKDAPFAVRWLQGPLADDAVAAAAALSGEAVAWVVVDHYGLDQSWHEHLRDQLGCRIAVVDDLADRPLAPDLLVDPNDPDAAGRYAPRLGRACKLLAGPQFALLDPLYVDAPRYRFREPVASIGIFMGGTDRHGACVAALRACGSVGFDGPIEVVSSPLGPHYRTLAAACALRPATILVDSLPDLAEFFVRHDLQIGAGGGATWERCCIGVPTVACVVAPNQLTTLPKLQAWGAVEWAREGDGGLEPAIAEAVRTLLGNPRRRRQLSDVASRLVDGRGALHVAAVMSFMAGGVPRIREARAHDEDLLLEWANDPEVRANAFRRDPISRQEHARWLHPRLADAERCRIFVAEATNGVAAGQVRFDRRSEGWEISYSIARPFRGIGLGTPLLRAALAALPAGAEAVVGRVKPDNVASARVFQNLGFSRSEVQDERGAYWLFHCKHAKPDNTQP